MKRNPIFNQRVEFFMSDMMPAATDLILVALMPSPRDMQIARVLGWYRIPVRTAPKILRVDYLAFYQPASFGEDHRWRVETIAPVRGHELTTRVQLLSEEPDHPRADEEYYKIQLGPLHILPTPIMAGDWKRFTFLYTTGKHLRKAQKLTDLTVRTAERQQLWKALCDRASSTETYHTEDGQKQHLSPQILVEVLTMVSGENIGEGSPADDW
jgi:hypothetical protein